MGVEDGGHFAGKGEKKTRDKRRGILGRGVLREEAFVLFETTMGVNPKHV